MTAESPVLITTERFTQPACAINVQIRRNNSNEQNLLLVFLAGMLQ